MKRLIYILTILCISLVFMHLNKDKSIARYVHFDSRGIETDATKFVTSGEYYFDCELNQLVRRIPVKFPIKEILCLPIEYDLLYDKELDTAIELFLADPGWANGFSYAYTVIFDEYAFITNHVFHKGISIGDNKYVISLYYSLLMKRVSLFVKRYNPNTYRSYEQRCEQAKDSCSEPQ